MLKANSITRNAAANLLCNSLFLLYVFAYFSLTVEIHFNLSKLFVYLQPAENKQNKTLNLPLKLI